MKKCIAFLLAACLLVAPVLRPRQAAAVAPTGISVIGGAIGTGGLAGGAAVGATILPVLGVVGLTLAAAGLTVYIGDQAAAEGMTRTEYIAQKISDFAMATGSTADQVYNDLSGQLETTSDGNVIIGRVAADWIGRFGDWLFSSGAVNPDDVSGTTTGGTAYRGWPSKFGYAVNSYSVFGQTYSYNGACFVGAHNQSQGATHLTWICVGSLTPATIGGVTLSSATHNGTRFYYGMISTGYHNVNDLPTTNYYYYSGGSQSNFPTAGIAENMLFHGEVADKLDGFEGREETWTQNRDLLKPGEDDVTVLTPPDVLNPAGAAAGAGEYTISVPDYLTALADAYNAAGAADASIAVPLTNTASGVKQAVDVQAAAVDTSPSVAVDSDGFSGTSGLVDPEAQPSAENVIDAMRVDVRLQDVFPFSIPYNFFHLLEQFVAEPVVPQWDFAYTFPIGEGVPVDWHMDLTPYATWAVVIRWAVRVGWMATLASAAQRRIKF